MPALSRKRARAEREFPNSTDPQQAAANPTTEALYEQSAESSPHSPSPGLGQSFEHRRAALLYQLSPLYTPPSLPSLASEHATLVDVLERTLTSRSNNACLLVGFAGSGKSALTQSALLELARRHAPRGRSFTVVRLSGRLHADDTAAMRELVRQLTADLEIEKPPASADFATLLAYLRDILSSAHFASVPVLFVLEALEGFAEGKVKQTLLYNLCSLLQEEYQVAIVAHTQRIDCFELLEKRIKSRLSARRIHTPHLSDVRDLAAILSDRLTLTAEGIRKALGKKSPFDLDFVPGAVLLDDEAVRKERLSSAVTRHNAAVKAVMSDEALLPLLRHQLQLGKSVRWFLTWLASAVCQLTAERPFPTVDLFIAVIRAASTNPRKEQLKFCSVAEWCVLVSALHVEAKGIRPYCHAVLYDEYCTFRAKHSASTIEVFPAALFLASFERLLARGVLVLERGTQGAVDCGLCLPSLVDRQFMSVRRGAGKDELEDCLSGNEVVLPQWLKTWALKERTE